MSEATYLTQQGMDRLKAELEHLKGPRRTDLAKRLRSAIQMGDLSENADYHKAKEDQAFLEGRIQEIEYVLRNAVVIEKSTQMDVVGTWEPRYGPGRRLAAGNLSPGWSQGGRSPQRQDLQRIPTRSCSRRTRRRRRR